MNPKNRKWLELGKIRDAARRFDHWLSEYGIFLQQVDERADLYPERKAALRNAAYQETFNQLREAKLQLNKALAELKTDIETRLPELPLSYGRSEAVSERAYWLNLAQSSLGGDPWSVLHVLRRDLPGAPPLARDTFLRVAEGAIHRANDANASRAFAKVKSEFMTDGERQAIARRAAAKAVEQHLALMVDTHWGPVGQLDSIKSGWRDGVTATGTFYGEDVMRSLEARARDAGDKAYAATFPDGAAPQDAAA